ncbi:hypothetical protein H0N95_03100 [Candidatus Micrarchaeota archaeon]|nr:hypothetical protein [Candidatus Micrarchaeota archaeon]
MNKNDVFSFFTSIIATSFYFSIVFSLLSSSNFLVYMRNFLVFNFSAVLAPTLGIVWLWSGKKSDLNVSDRKTRQSIYYLALFGSFLGLVCFYFLNERLMFLVSESYFLTLIVFAFINMKWRISLHTAGFTLPITALTFALGPVALPLHLLVLPVMWQRVKSKAHTAAQAVMGSVLAGLITCFVFYFL